MCTIIVMHRWHRALPLVVAANRDEFYDRPVLPPAVLHTEPLAVGGRDARHGGSWFGVTAAGLVVALTNQRSDQPPDPSRQSRGQIVVDALACGTVAGVIDHLARLDARAFNPFNLLVADASEALVGYGRLETPRVTFEPVSGRLVVLANDRLGSAEFPKTARATRLVEPLRDAPWHELRAGLEASLADHELPPIDRLPAPRPGAPFGRELLAQLQALCVHTPIYGTRSASIVAARAGRVDHYLTCPTAPCQGTFQDSTALVDPAR